MKKLLSILLSAALVLGLALPALGAEGSATDRLTQVTQAVKDTLELDTTAYDDFRGDCYEQELTSIWSLFWSSSTGSLSVEALEDGTVISYRVNDDYVPAYEGGNGSLPAFPDGDGEGLKEAAQAFLDKVLDSDAESVELGEPTGLDRLDSTTARFSGTILLNGLPSPLSYSITLRIADGTVTNFWRDVPETVCLGDIPDSHAAVTTAQAAALLKDTLSLRLEYVLPEDGADIAVLRYLPDPIHDFYVDAATGELVDLTELEEKMYTFGGGNSGAAGDSAAPEASPDKGELTEAEQAGIAKLDGVLSTNELDAALRDAAAYGLEDYTLTSAQYQLVEGTEVEEDQVRCTLRYSRAADEGTYSRTFTVDARTVELLTMRSSAPWDEDRTAVLDHDQALAAAQAFLEEYYGDHFGHLDLYDCSDAEGGSAFYSFTFSRKENGYFYDGNYYRVGIDAANGSVSALSYEYDEALTFDSPEGIITADQALDAWMATYETTLGYLLVPQPLDENDPAAQRLMGMGLSYFYELELGYALERENYLLGVDAKTGQPVQPETSGSAGLTYDDVEGHWAQTDILRLAQYGVGYDAPSFQPRKQMTQWDLVCLLASVQGYCLDPEQASEDERDQAYAIVWSMGALTRAERDDDSLLTRADVVRILLNSAGLGGVAKLEGIFTCSYADRDDIPADELGYAALAQGLGMIQGEYAGSRTATRAEAAALLARLMENRDI